MRAICCAGVALLVLLSSCAREPAVFTTRAGTLDAVEYQVVHVRHKHGGVQFDLRLRNTGNSEVDVYVLDAETPQGPVPVVHRFWLGDVITCFPTTLKPRESKKEHFFIDYPGTNGVTLGRYLVTGVDLSRYDCLQLRSLADSLAARRP